jgi:DNA-binding response OmpR family regulator
VQELILVVDDEPKVVKLARDYLEKNGFRVVSTGEGNTALAMARRERPDLIILDLMLPGMDGREVCRSLRRETEVPIIMLTALSEESDQIVGLEIGADDYITKPFSPRTLVARVRAVLRRSQGRLRAPAILRSGGLEIDLAGHQVKLDGKAVHLTPNEFKTLSLLARHPGQIFSREQLSDEMHGITISGFDRSVDSHIKNLRRKIETDPAQPRFIETVYGVGYRFVEQD